ncbi:hypothetical protein BH23GEM9_BH23GEM9_08030 [soil metagenome]
MRNTTGSGEAIAFTAVLFALTLLLLASTTGLQASAAIVPRVVGVPLAALLGYTLIRELRGQRARRAEHGADRSTQTPGETGEIAAILWLLALPALSTILGFVAGPALHVFGWARFRAGERIGVALAAGAATAVAIILLFGGLLGARLPQGILEFLF